VIDDQLNKETVGQLKDFLKIRNMKRYVKIQNEETRRVLKNESKN